jgi:hypothetical protein
MRCRSSAAPTGLGPVGCSMCGVGRAQVPVGVADLGGRSVGKWSTCGPVASVSRSLGRPGLARWSARPNFVRHRPELARFNDALVAATESLCNSEKLWTLSSGLTLEDGKPTERLERLWQLVVGHYAHIAPVFSR